jgi:hypothetical protein
MATREDYINSLHNRYGNRDALEAREMFSNGTVAYQFQPKVETGDYDYVQIPFLGPLFASTAGSVTGMLGGAAEMAGAQDVADYFTDLAENNRNRVAYWHGEDVKPAWSSDYILGQNGLVADLGDILGPMAATAAMALPFLRP